MNENHPTFIQNINYYAPQPPPAMSVALHEISTDLADNYTSHANSLARVYDILGAVNSLRRAANLSRAVVTEPGAVYCRVIVLDGRSAAGFEPDTLFVVNLISGKMLAATEQGLPDEPTGANAINWRHNIWQEDPLDSLSPRGELMVVASSAARIKKILQVSPKTTCTTTPTRYHTDYALKA